MMGAFVRAHRVAAVLAAQAVLTGILSWRLFPTAGAVDYGDGVLMRNVRLVPTYTIGALSPNYLGQDQSSASFLSVPKGLLTWVLTSCGVPLDLVSYLLSFGLLWLCAATVSIVIFRVSRIASLALVAGFYMQLNGLSVDAIFFGIFGFFFVGTIALALLLHRFWRASQRGWQRRDTIFTALTSVLLVHPFFLVIYLVLLAAYFLPRCLGPSWRSAVPHAAATVSLTCATCAYWLGPLVAGAASRGAGGTYAAGNLDGVYQGFIRVARAGGAFRLIAHPGSATSVLYDTPVAIIAAFAVPIGALILIACVDEYRSHFAWVITVFVMFLSAGLGPNSALTGSAWDFAWTHSSLVHFFRSFTRFFAPLPLLLVAVYALAARALPAQHVARGAIAATGVLLIASLPVMNGALGGAIHHSELPPSYESVRKIIAEDSRKVSIVAYPNSSYELYRWNVNSNRAAPAQSYFLQDYLFTKPVLFERASLGLSTAAPDAVGRAFREPNSLGLVETLRSLNIGFVLVHKDLVDSRGKSIDAEPHLTFWSSHATTLFTSNDLVLFRIGGADALVQASGSAITRVENPSRILIDLSTKETGAVRFNRNFDRGWSLMAVPLRSRGLCTAPMAGDVNSECGDEQAWDYVDTVLMPGARQIPGLAHSAEDGWANSWRFDPRLLASSLPKDYWRQGKDGELRFRLLAVYQPQRTMYVSWFLSGVTVLGLFAALMLWRNHRHSHGEETQALVRRRSGAKARVFLTVAPVVAVPVLLSMNGVSPGVVVIIALYVVGLFFGGVSKRTVLLTAVAQVLIAAVFEVIARPDAADVTLASTTALLLLWMWRSVLLPLPATPPLSRQDSQV